jgi:hypothetical protein
MHIAQTPVVCAANLLKFEIRQPVGGLYPWEDFSLPAGGYIPPIGQVVQTAERLWRS